MTLAAAAAALRDGDVGGARRRIAALPPADPAVAHLDAIVAWREGRIDHARRRFRDALAAAARADWLADAADVEAAAGDAAAAAALFRRAIAADPAAAPPLRLRLGLALIAGERLVEAIAELEALVRDVPHSPSAWQALGAARRQADGVAGAAAAFEQVLRLRPADPLALLSRAQVAADLGRPAAEPYRRALAGGAGHPARLGLAAALAAEGRSGEAAAALRAGIALDPAWEAGWTALASVEHRSGGGDALRATARAMFEAQPGNGALRLAAIRLLARGGDHAAALDWIGEARAAGGDSPPLRLAEAEALDATGRGGAAARILDALAPLGEPAVDFARVRHALRTGRPDLAAALAERLAAGPGATLAWAYLGSAWRMLGDARAQWLEGDGRLVGVHDLGLGAAGLEAIAARLRTLHRGRHAPFEQSMRGGTQTEGALLSREEPELRRLRDALAEAVRAHAAALPPADPRHPTLALPRDRFRFVGSWSVRLSGGGHHVNHVHGEGWLSSACHIVLPGAGGGGGGGGGEGAGGGGGGAGMLTLGEPPQELRTGLSAFRVVRPVAGAVVLFPSIMWHGTTPVAAGERLTVAFDVRPLS